MISNLHTAWAKLFVRAAASAGVTDVVLSPGSRSTPLAIAAAEDPGVRLHVVVDERAAAFFALGQARVTGRPSMLVCTSGTAGAHYFPAIIEASQSHIPLIAVTADRPWELYDATAPQTIDQIKLFGDFVRHYAELGLPDATPAAIRAVPRIAAQMVARALGPTPGPVHLNARFRKPLDPVRVPAPEPWEPLVAALSARGAPAVHAPATIPDHAAIDAVVERIAHAERGLIVCGPAPITQAAARNAILELARRTGFPVLAEATSQIRFGGERAGVVTCSAFDAILRAPAWRERHLPDLILEMGAPPTSGAYADLLAQAHGIARFVIAPHGWNDPQSEATALIHAEPAAVARAVSARLPVRIGAIPPWASAFARADARAATVIDGALEEGFSEAKVARALIASCPEGAILAVGNSTPVRDLDAYCPASPHCVRVLHQRGASGIDGLVSGAAGARSVSADPVALLLGDLSLLHDLGGIALLARAEGPLPVVVVQNGGGRIFEQLPIARAADAAVFERCFATPTPVRFGSVAVGFGVGYARVETEGALQEALAQAWTAKGATLIEAVVPPHGGAEIAARIKVELAHDLAE